jgi:triacylglycerol lipase
MSSYLFQADINKFDAHTTRYNGENALVLADCAKLAYQSEPTIREAMQKTWMFRNFEFFDSGESTQAFIAGNETAIIIAFRGTEIKKIKDVINDKRFIPTTGSAGTVHRGFNAALHEVWGVNAKKDMRPYIKKFQDKNQSIWFCGHSLGAALATLAAAEYVINEGGTVNGLYTIGQPRIGNDLFASVFNKAVSDRCFRFVNNNDIVTRIPISLPVFKYTHVGNALYLDSKGRLHDVLPWWKKAWDRIKGISEDIGEIGPDIVNDHDSKKYVDWLVKNRSVITKWS